MRGRSIIDMRSTRTEELVLVEDELEVLSDEDVEEAWAELEVEVVMMEGRRPESPTTKVRTSLEKQREEKAKERGERAARRARRSRDWEEGEGEGDEGEMRRALRRSKMGRPQPHLRHF